jgi:hypothetical protein
MKSLFNKFKLVGDESHEGFNPSSAIVVSLLLLLFVGTSVYLMLTNF